jgi:hypothetical protein
MCINKYLKSIFLILIFIGVRVADCQVSLTYSELNTVLTEDSDHYNLELILAIEQPSSVDSMSVAISNEDNEVIYSSSQDMAAWINTTAKRVEGNTLYLTILLGQFGIYSILTTDIRLVPVIGDPNVYQFTKRVQ